MIETYQLKLNFAKHIGYKSVAEAIGALGITAFNNRYKISDFEEVKTEKTIPLSTICKPLMFDNNYIIYADGRVWTTYNKMFLIPKKVYGHNGTIYYVYNLRNRKKYRIARLVWLHFGNSGKEDYKSIEKITYKDGDSSNWHIDNLIE